MRFSVSKQEFLVSLQKLQRVLPTKPVLPVLAAIHILVEQNKLLLTATDLYLGIRTTALVKISEPGKTVVPGKLLIAAVQSFPEGEIQVSQKDNTLTLKTTGTKVTLQTLIVAEYPEFPEVIGEKATITTSDLLAVEQYVLPSVSKDATRPVLTAVQLQLSTTAFRAVSTDGFRLSVFGSTTHTEETKTLLIPGRALVEYIKLAQAEDISQIQVQISSQLQQVLAEIGSTLIFSRLVEGEFPPFEQIIPSSATTTVTCDADELLEQVRRAHVLTSASSHIVQFAFTPESVNISTPTTTEGSFEGSLVSAKTQGEAITVAFNALYLLDMLKQFSAQEITIELTESLKPVLFKITSIPTFLYVVMPFRVI